MTPRRRPRATVLVAAGALCASPWALASPAGAAEDKVRVGKTQLSQTAGGRARLSVTVRWHLPTLRASGRHRGTAVMRIRGRGREGVLLRLVASEPLSVRRQVRTYIFTVDRNLSRRLGRGRTRAAQATATADFSATQQRDADGDGDHEVNILVEASSNCDDIGPNVVLQGCDLDGAWLADADLAGSDVSEANLAGAVLTGANLQFVNFAVSVLAGTEAREANAAGAFMAGVKAPDVDFTGANLVNVDFSDAFLAGGNVDGATLTGVVCRSTTWVDGSLLNACPGA